MRHIHTIAVHYNITQYGTSSVAIVDVRNALAVKPRGETICIYIYYIVYMNGGLEVKR